MKHLAGLGVEGESFGTLRAAEQTDGWTRGGLAGKDVQLEDGIRHCFWAALSSPIKD